MEHTKKMVAASTSQPGSRWIRLSWVDGVLPSIPACYAIFDGDRLLYIGSAKNLRRRFMNHQIEVGRINNVSTGCDPRNIEVAYRPHVKYGDWAMVEIRLIERLTPPVNINHSSSKTAVRDRAIPPYGRIPLRSTKAQQEAR